MKKKLIVLSSFVLGFAPLVALAQTGNCGLGGSFEFVLCKVSLWLNTIIPILIVLGVLYFIWGVITYVISKDEEAKTRGRSVMIYGIIGLLVIVAVWGLVTLIRTSFGINLGGPIGVPCVPAPGVTCP